MLFRLVLVTFLLGSAVIVNVNDVESFNDPSYIAIVSLIVGTYVATLLYAFWIRRSWRFMLLTYGQLIGDAVLAAGLVLLTGGIHSIFTFLFFLTIFNGAVLLGRTGAMFAASCSSLGLAAIVVFQFGDFDFVWAILPETVPRSGRVPVYALIIHLVGFFTVAALSGYLAEKLGQVGSELERRRLDIKELRALNENIVRSLSSGLLTLDNEGRTTFFNEAAEAITGYSFANLNLRPIVEAIPEFEKVVAAASAVSELSSRPRIEQRMIRPDGAEVYLGISISALRNARNDQTGYILIFQDVTELKTMEAAVLRQEHLSAIGKLSAAIAHEIRNPLASISGSIEMLAMLLEPPEEERQLMDIVIREVDRLNGLIKDFLDYARPAQGRRKQVDLRDLIDDTLQIFARDPVAASVDVRLLPEQVEPMPVYADASQLQQVLWNLLRNACEAMPDGGIITVARSRHYDLRSRRNKLVVEVRDTGPGLSDSVLPSLFEPFFTTKDEGTGLGLATCHRIVIAHRGDIEAKNLAAGGAAFVITLPADEEADDTLPRSQSEDAPRQAELTEQMDVDDTSGAVSRAGRIVLQ